jgi:transcriptional antiterminator NusG
MITFGAEMKSSYGKDYKVSAAQSAHNQHFFTIQRRTFIPGGGKRLTNVPLRKRFEPPVVDPRSKTPWFLVYTEPARERHVARWLEWAGIRAYVPAHPPEWTTRRGVRRERQLVAFPRYLFVEITGDAQFSAIKGAAGVAGFVPENAPYPIPAEIVHRLIERQRAGFVMLPKERPLEAGEQVRVKEGPFASFNGLVEELHSRVVPVGEDGKQTAKVSLAKVLVDLFGRATPVELRVDQVERT